MQSKIFILALALLAGFLQAWAGRHSMEPDGVSYLDIASACAQGNWHSLANAYWSPLYPFLLSVIFRTFRPSVYWESTVTKMANFVIYALAIVLFNVLLHSLIRNSSVVNNADEEFEAVPVWAMWILGNTFLIFTVILFVPLWVVSPDLCVEALLFAAAALLIRLRTSNGAWLTCVLFGTVLGVAYLAKSVMFPLGFVFLVCGLIAMRPLKRAIPRTALATLCFLLVGLPFIIAMSKSKGRITFGDTGRIAYAEFVNGATHFVNWQGGPAGAGKPLHPTRELLDNPPLYEYATPIEGTYPPWYDPSYWYDGATAKFSLRRQLKAIYFTAQEYAAMLPYLSVPFAGFLGLAFWAHSHGTNWRNLRYQWVLWVPAGAGLALYALVYVESRFVAGFFALIWMGLLVGLRIRRHEANSTVVTCLTIAVAATLSAGIVWRAGRSAVRVVNPVPFESWQVADGLRSMGVYPREKVGIIGNSLNCYWAHLAGVRIIAEIPSEGTIPFWTSSPVEQERILNLFGRSGANAVIADSRIPANESASWQRIGNTNYFIHFFPSTGADVN